MRAKGPFTFIRNILTTVVMFLSMSLGLFYSTAAHSLVCSAYPADEERAQLCHSSGMVYNCHVRACVNSSLNSEINECSDPSKMTINLINACDAKMARVITDIQNQSCPSNSQRVTCEARGDVWNCAVMSCLTSEQNSELNSTLNECKVKSDLYQKQQCALANQSRVQEMVDEYKATHPDPTPEPTPSPTPTPTPTATPTATPTPVATSTPGPTPTVVPTAVPTVVPTAIPTPTPTPIPTATPTPTPTPIACDQTPTALECSAAGKKWSCEINSCVSFAQYIFIQRAKYTCAAKLTQSERNECQNRLANSSFKDVAAGEFCDERDPELLACEKDSTKVYNCNIPQCLHKAQNENLASNVDSCYKLSTSASEDCLKQAQKQAIEEEAAGLYCPDSVEKSKCRVEGMVWNCNVGQCLPPEYNAKFAKNTSSCYEKSTQAEIDTCIDLLKNQTVRDLAGGSLCPKNDAKLSCESSSGMVYNCQINQCLPKAYNDGLTDKAVDCYNLPENEKDACMRELELSTVRDLASGKICSTGTEKKACSSGEVFNCKLNMCLSSSYNDDFTDKAVACYGRSSERDRNACMAELENKTIVDVASGAACVVPAAKEKECSSEGKIWNCQIGLCVTSDYNKTFTARISACYRQQDSALREKCLNNVSDATIKEIAAGALCTSELDITRQKECTTESKVWNCNAGMCLTASYNEIFSSRAAECYATDKTEAQKESCIEELRKTTAVDIASGAMCTPKRGISCGSGTVYNCIVDQCLPEAYNAEFAEAASKCELMENSAAKEKCKADLKSKTTRDLASGAACPETDKIAECKAVGLVWNCNVGRCLSTSFNEDFTNSAVACYEKTVTADQNSCIQDLRIDTIQKLAKGSECSAAETTICGVGEVYNCNVGMCLQSSYNDKIAQKAVTCYEKESQSEQQLCLDQLEESTIREIASGDACADAAKSSECAAKGGQVWNCNIKMCVPQSYNDDIADKTVACYQKEGAARDTCLAELESSVKTDVATGKLCVEPAKQSACKNESKVYNCHVDSCLSEDYNNQLSDKVLSCIGSASEDACLSQLKTETIFDLASGKDCAQSDRAAQCSAEGRVWNCQVGQCLTKEYNDLFASKVVSCYDGKTADETAQCKDALKVSTAEDIAGGVLCDNSGNSNAQSCESSGKIWNCNANLCFDSKQNGEFAKEAAKCELQETEALKKNCREILETKTLYIAANSCDTASNAEAAECNGKPGKIWNCVAEMCLFQDDNKSLVEMIQKCNDKPSKAEKDKCMEEVAIIVKSPEEIDKQIDEKMFKFEDKASPMYMATAALPALAWGGLTAMNVKGICVSAGLNTAASVYAAVSIANAADEADEKLKKLKEEYDMYQQLKEEEGFRIENQIRTLKFYMRALKTAQEIAEDMSAQFASNSYMFMAAAAVGAIEAAMYWNGSIMSCGMANVAIGAVGAGLSLAAKGKADKTAKDMKDQQKKLQEIIDIYEKHYGGSGANRIDDGDGLAGRSSEFAGEGSSGSIQKINAQQIKASKLEGDLLDVSTNEITGVEAKPARNCADKDGKLDKACKCRETKSCFQIDSKNLNFGPSTNSISNAIGLSEALSDSNKVMRGELSGSEINRSALAARLDKATKVKNDMMDTLNGKLKQSGKTPLNIDEQFMRNYVAKNVPKSAFDSPTARRLTSLLSEPPVAAYAPKDKELAQKLKDAGLIKTFTPVQVITSPNQKKSLFDSEDMDTLASTDIDSESDPESTNEGGFDYTDGQVVKKPEVSIFQLLSHRYKVLRASGRFTLNQKKEAK